MRGQEQDAALFGPRGGDHVVVVRHHLSQAFLVAEPDPGILQDHRAGFAGGASGKRRARVAGLRRIGLQAPPVFARPGVDGAPGNAPDGVRDG
ncbi:hypothetical protein D3C72_1828270 [compost metagenome]